jgi:diguanylate cyclase (GGDEF)-like protein
MENSSTTFYLSDNMQQQLCGSVRLLCDKAIQNKTHILKDIKAQLSMIYQNSYSNQQTIGVWIGCFIGEFIPYITKIKDKHNENDYNFLSIISHIPFTEESLLYQPFLESITAAAVAPTPPDKYLLQLQLAEILTMLGSEKAQIPITELLNIKPDTQYYNIYTSYNLLLCAKLESIKRNFLEEQLLWIELLIQAWNYLDYDCTLYFILEWINSLKWIRPGELRKNLLLKVEKTCRQSISINQAKLDYAIFSIHDKSITSAEKLHYLNKLRSMPMNLMNVEQFQSMYYFAGNIKSAVDSSFMESVSDYQYSNYYTYKRWEKIRLINSYLRRYLPPLDYIVIQPKVEVMIVELINQINIQSNVYVETLQDNFQKIEQLYKKVEELSLTDTLTGLHNRRYLTNNINELMILATRHQNPVTFGMMDIDHFKKINDTYGHLVGDYVLQEIATILNSFFRKSDFIIRYGGEEFLVVLFDSDSLVSELLMDGFRLNIHSHKFVYQEITLDITISIGYACLIFESDSSAYNLDYLISEADKALYESKHNGRNRCTGKIINLS